MYNTIITEIGESMSELLDCGILVLFNENVPITLRKISVLHTIEELRAPVEVNDTVILGKQKYRVTAVGSKANKTLIAMGHCTFSFKGKETALIPGQIELLGDGKPEIKVGECLKIYSGKD